MSIYFYILRVKGTNLREPASRALPPWALLSRAFGAPGIRVIREDTSECMSREVAEDAEGF
jgi:hypothetical protein